ncbi:hypothetical protein ACVWXM_003920 [Bradyrhizobium sp. GM7.3]
MFETIDRSLAEINEVVRGMPDDIIRSREPALHRRLKQLSDSLPQLKSAWIFDADGKSLVNSLASPPPAQSFADRDYFAAHVDQTIGSYIGVPLTPRQPYQGARFFGVSRRRGSDDGSFIGVIQASVLPEYIRELLCPDRLRPWQLPRHGTHRRRGAGASSAAGSRPQARS